MIFMRQIIIFFVSSILLCNQAITAQSSKRINNDSLQVSQKMLSFVNDFNNLNWEPFRENFAEDITVFLDGDTTTLVQGRKGVEKLFKSLFDAVRSQKKGPPYLDISPTNIVIQVMSKTVIVTFHSEKGSYISRRTFVWYKTNMGWLIVHIHGSARSKD